MWKDGYYVWWTRKYGEEIVWSNSMSVKSRYSGLWYRVLLWWDANVSEFHAAYVFTSAMLILYHNTTRRHNPTDLDLKHNRHESLKNRIIQCSSTGKGVCVLNQAPRHEDVWGERKYSSKHTLTLALDGGVWSASRPSRLTWGTRRIREQVGPRAGLGIVLKRKIPHLPPEIEPRTFARTILKFAWRYWKKNH
jgi:hypothetical protein